MEKSHDKLEQITNKWVEEAGIEQPSANFVSNVMGVIDAKATRKQVYRPLISRKAWLWVAAMAVASIALIYYLPEGQNSLFTNLEAPLLSFERPFQGVELSKTMIYAIGFLALFLVQIPFLKRKYIN